MTVKTSVPGRENDGYILLDILVALLVAMIGFGSLFGALKTAVDHTVKNRSVFLTALEERNRRAYEFEKNIVPQ